MAKDLSLSQGKCSFRSHRQKLLDAAIKRGKRASNIWSVYGPKIELDCVFLTDAEYLNFNWMEGDPSVVSYDIESEIFLADSDERHGESHPDAIVVYADGRKTWREVEVHEVSPDIDVRDFKQKQRQERITQELGLTYEGITLEVLKSHWQLITNWRRAIPFIAAARHLDILRFTEEATAFVDHKSKVSLQEFLSLYDEIERSLATAGALRCAQLGRIHTDLDRCKLGSRTLLERTNV